MIVALSHSVTRQPGRLSSSLSLSSVSPTVLQYEDRWTTPREIHWLDCSTVPPKPFEGITVTHTDQNQIHDMCSAQNEGKQLFITTQAADGVCAYNASTDKLEWSLEGKLLGMKQEISAEAVTTDGFGSLFMYDANNACIQVCSVDGSYLGTVLKEENQNLAKPWRICWCSKISSLIVAHTKEKQYHISMIRDTTQRDEIQIEMQAAPSRTESIETRHKDPAQVIAFTIKPVTEVAEKLPIEPIGAPSTPPTSEPVCDDVSDADLSLSEDARTTSNKQQLLQETYQPLKPNQPPQE